MNIGRFRSETEHSENKTAASVQEPTIEDSGGSGYWRRKLLAGAIVLVAGMYLRRRLGRSDDHQQSKSQDETAGDRDMQAPKRSDSSRGIGRRLKMLVISTIVFAIARQVVRRIKRRR